MAEHLINAFEVSNDQVSFEIYLNDGRLMRVLDEPDGTWMQKGNALLVQGDNELKVAVRPAAGQPEIDPRAMIELKIFEGPFGIHPGEDGKVHEFTWSQAANPVRASDFKVIHQKTFASRAAQTRWSWEDAVPYTSADKTAILDIVTALHATLVARDYDAFAALNVVRDTELAQALDVKLTSLIKSDRLLLDSLMQQDDWAVEPLDLNALDVHDRAQGRLVEVTGPNKAGPIIAGAAGEQVEMPLTFSNLPDIGWTITR